MSTFQSESWQRRLVGLSCALMTLFLASLAMAYGRIDWGSNKTLKPRSDGKSWNVDIKIYLPSPPDVPSLPMKFVFDQKVYYERAMVDGDKIITRDVPIEGKQPIVEGVDVGFLDPASGKIQKRTRFTFKLHRDHGLECGQYRVTVKDARNNRPIGQPTTIILGGENEVIDRRSIVFSGEKKPKKKTDEKTDKKTDEKTDQASDDSQTEAEASPETGSKSEESSSLEEPPEDQASDSPEGEIKKKPGGCGCRVTESHDGSGSALALLLLTGACLYRRRRVSRPHVDGSAR